VRPHRFLTSMGYDSWVRAVPQAPGRVDRIVALGMAATLAAVLVTACRLATAAAPAEAAAAPDAAAAVPSQYQSAYSVVDAEVQNFARGGSGSTQPTRTTIGTELLSANGNIGSSLLAPEAIVGVDDELDAFQALGIQGVTVDVPFPLLLPSTSHSAGYLRFYEQVADQVKKRHMTLSIEENPIFAGTPLTTLSISYAGLTVQRYADEQRAQAQTILDTLRPRYLTVFTEPDTFTDTLGIDLNSPSSSVQVVSRELKGLHRNGTMVGAGTGTWSATSIDSALLARTSIDYLDVHVYPLGPQQIANLRADTAAAKADHKPLVMDETWLDKPSPSEGSGPSGAPAELKEKSYSFWEPLDEQYLAAMYSYVRSQGYHYASFFDGARAFFGYLPWSPALQASTYQSFSTAYNQLVADNMRRVEPSGTGLTLAHLLTG
jgi:hypothetical protein